MTIDGPPDFQAALTGALVALDRLGMADECWATLARIRPAEPGELRNGDAARITRYGHGKAEVIFDLQLVRLLAGLDPGARVDP